MAVIPSGTSEPWVWAVREAQENNATARMYMQLAERAAFQERQQGFTAAENELARTHQAQQQRDRLEWSTGQQDRQFEFQRERDADRTRTGFIATRAAAGDPEASALIDGIINAESSGNPTARNPNSSALGSGQFIDSTWAEVVNSPEGRAAGLTMNGRTDPQQSREATRIYASWNSRRLQQAGLQVTPANIYMLHFLGPGGTRFLQGLQRDPSMPAAMYVGRDQVAANRNVFFRRDGSPRSAGEVYELMSRRVGGNIQRGGQRAGYADAGWQRTMQPRLRQGGDDETWAGADGWNPQTPQQQWQQAQPRQSDWNADEAPQPATPAIAPAPQQAEVTPPSPAPAAEPAPVRPAQTVTAPSVPTPTASPRVWVRGPDGRPMRVQQ